MWPFRRRDKTRNPGDGSGSSGGNTTTLGDLARGLQHAAASTSALVAQQYLDLLDQFFDRGPANSYQPKLVRIVLPDGKLAEVPLISLIAPKSVALNRMRVGLKATVEQIEKFKSEDAELDASHARFTVAIREKASAGRGRFRPSDVMDIDLELTATEPPEAISRLLEQFTHQVRLIEPVTPANGDTPTGNGKS